jgi:chloride channel protein, CIC family
MLGESSEEADAPGSARSMLRLSLVAATGGVAIGFIAAGFRLLLLDADSLRASFLAWAHHWPAFGWALPVVVVAACAAAARWVIRLAPVATGSGIQDVEAVWRGDAGFAPWSVLPVKFAGGLVAIGSGLALGREGPTVHMGAVIGSGLGERFGLGDDDRRVLQTALGGAGLAVAFNAPLAGSLFVFEEVAKRFRFRLGIATLIGSSVAIACSWVLVSNHPYFLVGAVPVPPGWSIIVFALFGAATGLLGLAYNWLIIAGLDRFAHPLRWPPEFRAALVGGVVGLLLWFRPLAAGAGDVLVQGVLHGGFGRTVLLGYLVARFLVGPWSYSAGTPGGLFAPLLAVGAVWGALVQGLLAPLIPAIAGSPGTVAIVGMAAFFAAVVRAPFTGIVLIVEMTATTSLLVPLLAACFAAVLVCTALHGEPIYDSLRGRMPRA